ncbi:MAG TPA: MauE/DoxX family redox-associated membrane protein [Chitinophagaceae bacterium]|nr:MauE/DoxX family redox-associated membrane protein [Chitinophagaceae bacterium]
MSTRKIIVQSIAASLIFLFAYASLSKLFNFRTFRFTLGQMPVIGSYADPVTILIPAVNLLAVLLLLIPRTRKAGLFYSLFLLTGYTGYIGYVLLNFQQLPCSCNGIVPWLSWPQHFWLNLVIISLVITGLLLSKRFIAINPSALADADNRESRKPV